MSLVRIVAFAWLAVACGGEDKPGEVKTIYRDLPVDLEDTEWTPPIEGDPGLTVGVTEDQLFRELADGDDAPIIEGFQGGYWVHVAVRAVGVGRSGSIEGRLTIKGEDDPVGSLRADLKLVLTREGFSERPQVPISLTEDWQKRFSDLFGKSGAIRVIYIDLDGRKAEHEVQVVFVQN